MQHPAGCYVVLAKVTLHCKWKWKRDFKTHVLRDVEAQGGCVRQVSWFSSKPSCYLVHVSDSVATSRVSCAAVVWRFLWILWTTVRLLNGPPIFVGSRLQARRTELAQKCFSVDQIQMRCGKLLDKSPKYPKWWVAKQMPSRSLNYHRFSQTQD